MNDAKDRVNDGNAEDVEVRAYRDEDEGAVLGLLNAALGGGPAGSRPPDFFRWKHFANPFGRSYMLVAEASGRIVGLRAFMRWEFQTPDGRLRGVRAVDTATHPDYQGRGIFSTLTKRSLADLAREADLIFNTPNEKSLPGYLKMGWRVVGRVPIYIRIRRPIRFLKRIGSWAGEGARGSIRGETGGMPAAEALTLPGLERLLRTRQHWHGIETARSIEFLRWRYGDAPLLGYRAAVANDRDRLLGLALFRIRPRGDLTECTVAEVITQLGDSSTPRHLLAQVARSSRADHLTCSFPRTSTLASAARRSAFLRAPVGVTLVVNPLGHEPDPNPLDLGSWALSVGDIEVF